MTLTPKQKLFAQEYLVDLNATQAAIRAGYSKKTARQTGTENLSKPVIAERIQELMNERAERVKYTSDQALRDLAGIIRFDFRKLYDDFGDVLPVCEWPDDAVLGVAGHDVSSIRFSRDKDDEPLNLFTKKLKFRDKLKAIELAMKHNAVGAMDNTMKVELPPRVIRNFMGRKKAGFDR
jgi:phage terminase small subunit